MAKSNTLSILEISQRSRFDTDVIIVFFTETSSSNLYNEVMYVLSLIHMCELSCPLKYCCFSHWYFLAIMSPEISS